METKGKRPLHQLNEEEIVAYALGAAEARKAQLAGEKPNLPIDPNVYIKMPEGIPADRFMEGYLSILDSQARREQQ